MGISDIVTTRAGDQDSMDKLMIAYKDKLLPKDDLTQVLRAFQTAKNAITSKDRDLARAIFGRYNRDRSNIPEIHKSKVPHI